MTTTRTLRYLRFSGIQRSWYCCLDLATVRTAAEFDAAVREHLAHSTSTVGSSERSLAEDFGDGAAVAVFARASAIVAVVDFVVWVALLVLPLLVAMFVLPGLLVLLALLVMLVLLAMPVLLVLPVLRGLLRSAVAVAVIP